MFGFVGPNEVGKTTAMRIILGVLEPDAGQVRWHGQPMTDEMRKHLGYLRGPRTNVSSLVRTYLVRGGYTQGGLNPPTQHPDVPG
jgi:ABC-type uncharacterized transport system ATPase subunit